MDEQRERARADAAAKRAIVTVADLPAASSEFLGYGGLEAEGTIVAILLTGHRSRCVDRRRRRGAVDPRPHVVLRREGRSNRRPRQDRRRRSRFEVTDTQYAGEAIAHHGVAEERDAERRRARANGGRFRSGAKRSAVTTPRRTCCSVRCGTCSATRSCKPVRGSASIACDSIFAARSEPFRRSETRGRAARQRADSRRLSTSVTRELPPTKRPSPPARSRWPVRSTASSSASFGRPVGRVLRRDARALDRRARDVRLPGESSIGSGVRRIEAIVSRAAEAYVEKQQDLVGALSESLSVRPDELAERIERLQGELREMRAELGTIKAGWQPPTRRRTCKASAKSAANRSSPRSFTRPTPKLSRAWGRDSLAVQARRHRVGRRRRSKASASSSPRATIS